MKLPFLEDRKPKTLRMKLENLLRAVRPREAVPAVPRKPVSAPVPNPVPPNTPPTTGESDEPRRPRGCSGIFLVIMLVVAVIAGSSIGLFLYRINESKKTREALENFRPRVGSRVFSADGEVLGEFKFEACQEVALSSMPLHLQKAFVAREDDEFYNHRGVRPDAILNSALFAVKTGRVRGASTITMQVARMVESLGVGKDRTMSRKINEALVALQVERDFTKDEILELYMNTVFLGVSAYGVEAASWQYFNKSCREVTLGEAAMLAGLASDPNDNEPIRNPQGARDVRGRVLQQMLDNTLITREEFDKANAEDVEASVVSARERQVLRAEGKEGWAPNRFKAPYFSEEVRRFALNLMPKEVVFGEGLEIQTTVDMRLQRAAEEALFKALDSFDEQKRKELTAAGRESEFTPVTGAIVCIDNRTGYQGHVRALVGGRDFDKWKFNNATQGKRQPGSSIKPFVWATAIAEGLTPSTVVADEPYTLRNAWGNVYSPRNFSGEYMGPITLRTAIEKSVNIVSIKLIEYLTMPLVRSYIQAAGIRTPIPDTVGLTLALGSAEVTPFDQCVAYSTFANLGMRYDPVLVTRIKSRDGLVVYDTPPPMPEQAMSASVAYVMTHLLKGVAEYGTGTRTKELKRPRAGKTGTSNEAKNVWFCGFTPDYTTVVWMGYRDNHPLGQGKRVTGGALACPVWTQFMLKAEEGLPVRDFERPYGVNMRMVDKQSGVAGGSFEEAFVAGTEPPAIFQVYPLYRHESDLEREALTDVSTINAL